MKNKTFNKSLNGSCRTFLPQNFANANILGVPREVRHPFKVDTPLIIMSSLVAVTLLTGTILTSTKVLADNDTVVDEVSITVPTSCTMTSTGTSSHTATLNNGTFSGATGSDYENGIGTTTITSFCNDTNGFSIYAIGYTDNTAGNNTLIGTNASSNATIASGTATSGNTSNWSMKVTKVDNPVSGDPITYNPQNMTISSDTEGLFSSWHSVPDEYTKVAEYHANTGSSATDIGTNALGAKLTTTYAAYISPTQAADTYSGQVKYVMVHPYDDTAPTSSVSFSNAYAAASKTMLNGYYKMQDMSSAICSAVTLHGATSEITLIDSRDNKTYTVSKLADGNCWMIQNLDFDIVNGGSAINSTNTDVPSNWTDAGNLTDTYATDYTIWYYYNDQPESYDPGDLCWNGTITGGPISNRTTACTSSNINYHIGNYYNWTAAVAMSDSSSYTTDDEDVDQSICPAGWMLPKDGSDHSSGSFAYLVDEASLTAGDSGNIHQSPNYFIYGGGWYSGSYYVGDDGLYWSSVVHDDYAAYDFYFNADGDLYQDSYNTRDNSGSVRCVAR